jgi:hypothetical protein
LSLVECQEYIANRLKIAGANPNLFVSDGIEAVHQFSGGIPRLINVICDNAMISAYALEKREVELHMIQEVAEDLRLVSSPPKVTMVRRATPSLAEARVAPPSDVAKPASVQLVKNHRSTAAAVQSNVSAASTIVPESFLVSLRDALVDAIGPMAPIVLSEQVKHFGASMDRFPRDKIANLIESLSGEIFDESIRNQFRRGMSDGIRTLRSA